MSLCIISKICFNFIIIIPGLVKGVNSGAVVIKTQLVTSSTLTAQTQLQYVELLACMQLGCLSIGPITNL